MPTASYLQRRGRARDLLRPHRGRRLDAADLRRAGRPHPRHGARRPRPRCARTLLSWLPADLSRPAPARRRLRHRRAGGRGGAARRATSSRSTCRPTLVELAARARARATSGAGRIEFRVGDMLDPALGRFDHVVAMDSLIHYRADRRRAACWPASPRAPTRRSLFTFAPRTPLLALMHAVGRLFPRGDRAPAIEPVASAGAAAPDRRASPGSRGWRPARTERIAAASTPRRRMELVAAMRRAERQPSRAAGSRVGPRFLPFADAATPELPLARLLRLSLFQVSVGMAIVLLIGTLNRVMIVELGVPAWLVALMVSLPLLFAPLRALIGFRSDTHRSVLGWRRVPYIWIGTLLQFGGLAIMPFALLVLSGDTHGPVVDRPGRRRARLPAGRRRPAHDADGGPRARHRPRAGRRAAARRRAAVRDAAGRHGRQRAACFGALLADFSQIRLIQVIQGAALLTMVLNVIALWKQEARDPARTDPARARPSFRASWRAFAAQRPLAAPAGRRRARHRRLQHAGHPARALRRPDPACSRRRDDDADRAAGGRRARRLRARRAPARATAPIRTASPATARSPASSPSRR